MAEEFQESDVMFQEIARSIVREEDDINYNFSGHLDNSRLSRNDQKLNIKKSKKSKKIKNSVPVNIPENFSGNSWFQYVDSNFFDDDGEGEITPPHVILGRRIAEEVAFSVCSGNGRTLKGRHLSEVRNSILRMTGFLET